MIYIKVLTGCVTVEPGAKEVKAGYTAHQLRHSPRVRVDEHPLIAKCSCTLNKACINKKTQ